MFLLGLALVLLALTVQELTLLLGIHAAEETLAVLLLDLLRSQLALLGLLFLLDAAELLDLLLAGIAHLAHNLATPVSHLHESVGKAQVLVEERQGRGVVGADVDGQLKALLRGGLIDPRGTVSLV